MAKNNKAKWIGISLIITLAVLFVGIAGTWAVYGENIDDNAEAVEELKDEGCKPTIPLRLDVALVKRDIAIMKEDISDMRVEQKEGFTEILEILRPLPR